MQVPDFPKFQKLHLDQQKNIETYVSKYPPYSDYNFTSLWTYNTEEIIETSLLNNNLVVKFQDYITNDPFFSLLGTNQIVKTADQLLALSMSEGFKPLLKLVPEVVIRNNDDLQRRFNVQEDTDNHDYILSTEELARLVGGKYYDKRNLINRFWKNYPKAEVRELNLIDIKTQAEMNSLFLHWAEQAKRSKDDIATEWKAIERLLQSLDYFKIYGIGIFNENKLIGFSTHETSHDKYGIVSFQKADRSFDGVYSVLTQEIAKHLNGLGYQYINFEQDLGIEGLKKAKQLWRPVHYLKKYTISPKK